jgi:hypothetical protein
MQAHAPFSNCLNGQVIGYTRADGDGLVDSEVDAAVDRVGGDLTKVEMYHSVARSYTKAFGLWA